MDSVGYRKIRREIWIIGLVTLVSYKLNFYQTARHHIPQNSALHRDRRENLRFQTVIIYGEATQCGKLLPGIVEYGIRKNVEGRVFGLF